MSDNLTAAEAALRERVAGASLDGTVKFEIEDEGTLRFADGEVTREDGDADVTIAGSLDTFREMFDGALTPTAAFLTGRIRIDGDMSLAMRLSTLLD